MNTLKNIFSLLHRFHGLKYILAVCAAVVIIGFGGGNSLLAHYGYLSRINDLQAEIDGYDSEYRRDQAQIHELVNHPESMERIARERYFMKTADEDIFVLSDDDRKSQAKASADETLE